jgi:hypothetical protein
MAGLTGDVAMVTSGIQYAVFIIFTGVMWYVFTLPIVSGPHHR